QAVLAAHITQAPASVSSHRQAVPAVLDELLLRLLAKRPADRPQRAAEVLPRLEGMLTPTGTRPMTIGNPTTSPPHPARTGLLFVLASAGVLAIAALLVRLLGLPDWVTVGTTALLAIGLPITLLAIHFERARGLATGNGFLSRFITRRRALLGGAIAFGGLGV